MMKKFNRRGVRSKGGESYGERKEAIVVKKSTTIYGKACRVPI